MKKLFLPVLSLALVISAAIMPAAHAEFNDVDSSYEYRTAINSLASLDVINGYEGNVFKPLNNITRAEFAKMLVCTLGFEGKIMPDAPFSDVSGHWAKSYISSAVGLKIVNGFEDNTFRPDNNVTYEQCLTMLDRALGYEADAEQRGGYPEGYIRAAANIGLTDNISGQGNSDPATRGVVAQLIYNALDVPILNAIPGATTSGKEGDEESTLLNTYLDVTRLTGVVVGVSEYVTNECTVSLYPSQMDILSRGKEYIIDFSQYTESVTDINKFLGQTVTVYYKQPKSSDDLILYAIDGTTAANTNIEISYKDIYSYNGSVLKYYTPDGSMKSLKINPDTMTIRYNGRTIENQNKNNIELKDGRSVALTEALKEWFDVDSPNCIYGDITFTASAGGQVNLAQINDYKVIVALRTPSTTDYRIMDKLVSGNSLTLDPDSNDYTYTITKNNLQIPVTSIAANDIILYEQSLDGDLYTAVVTSKSIEGTVSSTDSAISTVTINGTKYDVGDHCLDYIATNQSGQTIKTGVSGTFYLDKYNTIVYATIKEETAAPYAYIANAFTDDSAEECYITVFESAKSASSTKSYKLKPKVKFNGSTVDDDTAIARLAATAKSNNADVDFAQDIYGRGQSPKLKPDGQNGIYSQVARVGFDGDEVSSIVTIDDSSEGSANENKEKIVRQRSLASYDYRSNSFSLGGSNNVITTNSSTVVLCIPQDRTSKTGYAQKSVSSAFSSGESYYVEAYDVNSSRVASLILLYSGSNASLTAVNKSTNFAIVSDYPSSTVDSSTGENALSLSMYWGPENSSATSEKTWNTFDEDEFADAEIGDVIQFSYNTLKQIQGRINNIRFRDIEEILNGKLSDDGYIYDWSEGVNQSTDPNHQTYKFDYRFKTRTASGEYIDEMYTNSSLGSVPYSRAAMFNVLQVIPDTNQIYVTKNGFDSDGKLVNDDEYEVVKISASTRFLRMEDDREGFSPYVENTATTLKIDDLRDVQYYGAECSKILVCSKEGDAKLIVMYD